MAKYKKSHLHKNAVSGWKESVNYVTFVRHVLSFVNTVNNYDYL